MLTKKLTETQCNIIYKLNTNKMFKNIITETNNEIKFTKLPFTEILIVESPVDLPIEQKIKLNEVIQRPIILWVHNPKAEKIQTILIQE